MKKTTTILVVLLLIIAGVGIIMYGMPAIGGDAGIQAEATVYVQPLGSTNAYQAKVSMAPLSLTEQLMMSMGMGIRKAQFEPMATASLATISWSGQYQMWGTVRAKATVTGDLTVMKDITATFTGVPGTVQTDNTNPPNHATETNSVLCRANGEAAPRVQLTTGLVFGTEYLLDQSASVTSTFKFDKRCNLDTLAIAPIYGDEIDGATMKVQVGVNAANAAGTQTYKMAEATLKIEVIAWDYTQLTVTITSFNVTVTPAAAMILPFDVGMEVRTGAVPD